MVATTALTPGQIVDRLMNLGQLVTLIVGIVIVSIKVGARDQILTNHGEKIAELQSLVRELASVQTSMLTYDAASAAERVAVRDQIADISHRLRELEIKR